MGIQPDVARERVRHCVNNPKQLITYLWFTTMAFGLMYSLMAIVASINNNGDSEADSKSLGFVGVWAMFLFIGISVGGTLVMRKYQTPLAVGFFIGVVIMMSLQMFTLSILFAGAAYLARMEREKGDTHASVHSNDFGSVFSFFMFILYGIFAIVLIKHRNIVIKEGVNLDVESLNINIVNTTSGSSFYPSEEKKKQYSNSSPSAGESQVEIDTLKPTAPPVSV